MEDGSKEQFALHFNVSRISIKQSQLRQTNPWFDSNIERYWCNFQIHVARKPFEASVLIYGLVLDSNPAVREKQQALVARLAGPEAARLLEEMRPTLSLVQEQARLPLVQLTLPALHSLEAAALDRFVSALDELVRADGKMSVFEFALQKVLLHHLQTGKAPNGPGDQIYSFSAVAPEIAAVLSALSHASSDDAAAAAQAFAAGASQLKMLEGQLALDAGAVDFVRLDVALDKLATASGPIKQRLLTAAAHVVNADGVVLVSEAELLRAIAATLDVPLPPVMAAA